MGFFKLFYFLKRILYKIPKKVLVYILIFIILMLFTTSSHASQIAVTNIPNADIVENYKTQIDMNYYNYVYNSIRYAESNNNQFQTNFRATCRYIVLQGNRYVFFVADDNYMNLYAKKTNGSSYPIDNLNRHLYFISCWGENIGNPENIVIPGTANTSNSVSRELEADWYNGCMVVDFNISTTSYSTTWNNNVVIPYSFCHYLPGDLYDIIYSIAQDSFDFSTSEQILSEISQKLDETNQQLEDMNNFFTDDTTPTVTNNDLPSDNMNDITRDGFNGIFTKLFEATNTNTVETVIIPIPFLNYSFTVSSNYLENIIRGWEIYLPNSIDASILTLIYIIWRFIIYRYIVLDIYKYINDFKNGNISKTDTNIKADML